MSKFIYDITFNFYSKTLLECVIDLNFKYAVSLI